MSKVVGVQVLQELKELIQLIDTKVANVPGRVRLKRACEKELKNLENIPSDLLDDAVIGSNLPHFKAIFTLACAYGNRVVDLLCRYRIPPECSNQSTYFTDDNDYLDNSNSQFNDTHESSDYMWAEKRGSIMIDLICMQSEPINLNGIDYNHNQIRLDGNAKDAGLWFPALWIKVVSRDASRLNNAWLGELSSRQSCIARQSELINRVSQWYQRGQPKYWIRTVIHWLPSSASNNLDNLNIDLINCLKSLNVTFINNATPWIEENYSTDSLNFENPNKNNDHDAAADDNRNHLSVRHYMLPHQYVYDYLLNFQPSNQYAENILLTKQFCHKLQTISMNNNNNNNNHNHNSNLNASEQNKCNFHLSDLNNPMEAVLQRSIVWPFKNEIYEKLDQFSRINLDVSALIAFTSELSQIYPIELYNEQIDSSMDLNLKANYLLELLKSKQRCDQFKNHPLQSNSTRQWLINSESELPVLYVLDKYLQGKLPIVCLTALQSFLNILCTIAGPNEWDRSLKLISRLTLVPDVDTDGEVIPIFCKSVGQKSNNSIQTRRIIDVGNAFGALTVTSNSGFLRSVRKDGLRYSALLLPARALTETAESRQINKLSMS